MRRFMSKSLRYHIWISLFLQTNPLFFIWDKYWTSSIEVFITLSFKNVTEKSAFRHIFVLSYQINTQTHKIPQENHKRTNMWQTQVTLLNALLERVYILMWRKEQENLHGKVSFPPETKFNLCTQLSEGQVTGRTLAFIYPAVSKAISQFGLWLQTPQREKKNPTYIAGRLDSNPSCPSKSLIVIASWKIRDVICASKTFSDRSDNSFHPVLPCIRNTCFWRLKLWIIIDIFKTKLEQMKSILI